MVRGAQFEEEVTQTVVDFNKPLQDDVNLLSKILTQTIKDYAGIAGGCPKKLETTIETLLTTSKMYFEDDCLANFNNCVQQITKLSESELLEVARVFLEFLILAEVSERQHRVRRWYFLYMNILIHALSF